MRTYSGKRNPNWRGGRGVSSHGYVLVNVGKRRPDGRGSRYQYEHRLVAEDVLGRSLLHGEIVHHKNGDKQDNRPENIVVVRGNARHYVHHRRSSHLRKPDEPNPDVACACGCGAVFVRYDVAGRPRRFVSGHNGRRHPHG